VFFLQHGVDTVAGEHQVLAVQVAVLVVGIDLFRCATVQAATPWARVEGEPIDGYAEWSMRQSVRNVPARAREKGFQSVVFLLIWTRSGGYNQERAKGIMENKLR
jgi:hypothetical protein